MINNMRPPPLEFLFPQGVGTDLIYSFVIIICSLMVYHATKEMYELSSYKGLKYFRQAFLFFAAAYFFRYFIQFFINFLNIKDILEFSPGYLGGISMFLFLFSSSMAVFYLLYSVMWKKWNHSKSKLFLFNLIAIMIALIGSSSRGRGIAMILINILLLIFVSFILIIAYQNSRKKEKGKSLFIIYLLLFIFWTLNVIDILIPKFLQMYQLAIYLISILLFMIILYKVLKKTGN